MHTQSERKAEKQPIIFRHPAFKDIPPSEYWRFIIDGTQQADVKKELGWLAYENREPGSVKAFLRAYAFMLDTVNHMRLDEDLIKEFHKIIMETSMTGKEKLTPGKYRNCLVQFPVKRNDNGSEKGIERLFAKEPKAVKFAVMSEHEYSWATKNDEKVYIRPLITNPEEISKGIQSILKEYYSGLAKIKEQKLQDDALNYAKLLNIVHCVQNLELSHPFDDGNGRTFCTLVLNKLLLENDFPPVILEDPNRFDGFTPDELVKEIENGFKAFATLKQHQPTTYEIIKLQIAQQEEQSILLKKARTSGNEKDKNDEEDYEEKRNSNLILPLHWAITSELPGLASQMIPLVKNINDVNFNNMTALMIASMRGDIELVNQLIKVPGINLHQQDSYGYTAAMWAAQSGHSETVAILQASDSKKNVQSIFHMTAEDILHFREAALNNALERPLNFLNKLSDILANNNYYIYPIDQDITQNDIKCLENITKILKASPPIKMDAIRLLSLYSSINQLNCTMIAKEQLLFELKNKIASIDLKNTPIVKAWENNYYMKFILSHAVSDLPNAKDIEEFAHTAKIVNHYDGHSFGSLSGFVKDMVKEKYFNDENNALDFILSRKELIPSYIRDSESIYYFEHCIKEYPDRKEKILEMVLADNKLAKTIFSNAGFYYLTELGKDFKDNPASQQKILDAFLQESKVTENPSYYKEELMKVFSTSHEKLITYFQEKYENKLSR